MAVIADHKNLESFCLYLQNINLKLHTELFNGKPHHHLISNMRDVHEMNIILKAITDFFGDKVDGRIFFDEDHKQITILEV